MKLVQWVSEDIQVLRVLRVNKVVLASLGRKGPRGTPVLLASQGRMVPQACEASLEKEVCLAPLVLQG